MPNEETEHGVLWQTYVATAVLSVCFWYLLPKAVSGRALEVLLGACVFVASVALFVYALRRERIADGASAGRAFVPALVPVLGLTSKMPFASHLVWLVASSIVLGASFRLGRWARKRGRSAIHNS